MPRSAPRFAAALLCWAPTSLGLGLQASAGTGPGEPRGRHIRYLFNRTGVRTAGMSDRISLFTILAELGEMHNATVHLRDLGGGPASYLSRAHSPNISARWEHYFDTGANHGNPWHAPVDMEGCAPLLGRKTDFSSIFRGGTTCADIPHSIYKYVQWEKVLAQSRARILPSLDVREAAYHVARDYRLRDGEYGSVHIRRCDRLEENRKCTDPQSIARALGRFSDVGTWVVFAYAEPGYAQLLSDALGQPGRTLLFEDDLLLNPARDGDNYFAYMVGREIVNRARVKVSTHLCEGAADPSVVVEGPGQRRAAVRDAALDGSAFGAVCGGGAARGP